MEESIRIKVLYFSINIEEKISISLSHFLNISDWENTKSFGTSTSSLTLSQKVNLLQDIVGKEVINNKYFTAFMVIRNKLIHVSVYNNISSILSKYKEHKNVFKELGVENFSDDIELSIAFEKLYDVLIKQIKELDNLTTQNTLDLIANRINPIFIKNYSAQLKDIRTYITNTSSLEKKTLLDILDREITK